MPRISQYIRNLTVTELLELVLIEVNQLRRPAPALTELPCGTREDFWADPLARALSVDGLHAEVVEQHVSWFRVTGPLRSYVRGVELPEVCQEFVRRFDLGLIPELVDVEAPIRRAALVA